MAEWDMGLLLLGVVGAFLVGAFLFAGTNIWLMAPPLQRSPVMERAWRQRRTP